MTQINDGRYIVISADCHAGADLLGYRPYLDRQWLDDFDAWARRYHDPWLELDPGREKYSVASDFHSGTASASTTANWDSERRIHDLEADGIIAEVLFPNTAPPFYPSGVLTAPAPSSRMEYERRRAGLHAHNRWLIDFCAEAPGRRAGVFQIFLNDVEDAVAEIEWAVEAGLRGGLLLPAVEPGSDLQPLYSAVYEPIWDVCESLGVPVNHHGAGSGQPTDEDGSSVCRAIVYVEHRFFCTRALWHLIMAGVFERHPSLTFVMTELGIDWVPSKLDELDQLFHRAGQAGATATKFIGPTVAQLRMLPSEYWARNCYVGASFLSRAEAQIRASIGVQRIMWGSDYPHSEGTFPWSREALRAALCDASPGDMQAILGGNAARVYGFDLQALCQTARRSGPTVSELATPLNAWPRMPEETSCPAFERVN